MCDAGLVVTKEAVREGKARAAAAAEAQRQVAAAEAVQQLQDAQAAAAAAVEQAAARPTRAGRARVAEAAAAVAAAEHQLARATMGRAKGSGKRGRQQQLGAQGAVGGAPSAQQALRAAALVDPLTANSGLCLLCNGPVGRKKGHRWGIAAHAASCKSLVSCPTPKYLLFRRVSRTLHCPSLPPSLPPNALLFCRLSRQLHHTPPPANPPCPAAVPLPTSPPSFATSLTCPRQASTAGCWDPAAESWGEAACGEALIAPARCDAALALKLGRRIASHPAS